MTNLKPCPFCGGEAERIDIPAEHDDIENAGGSCIQCSRCVASTALHFDRKENLESSWNDRKHAPLAAKFDDKDFIETPYPQPMKVCGVGRVADNRRAILVMLSEIPTDDELWSFHEFLRGWEP